jgi:type VI secretion system secreted protein Hcp
MADKKNDPPAADSVHHYRFSVRHSDGWEHVSHDADSAKWPVRPQGVAQVAQVAKSAAVVPKPVLLMVDVPVRRILVAVKGRTQGAFAVERSPDFVDQPGASPTHQFASGEISFAVSVAHDAATGAPTGRRMHEPLSLLKRTGPATPEFQRALVTRETLAEVIFDCYGDDASGKSVLAASVKLTNAAVASIDFEMPDVRDHAQASAPLTDLIALTFEQIEIARRTSSVSDDWRP